MSGNTFITPTKAPDDSLLMSQQIAAPPWGAKRVVEKSQMRPFGYKGISMRYIKTIDQ